MKAGNLVQLDENVYYFSDGINLGIVRTSETECAVIDTGMDDDSAMRLLAASEALGLEISAIINTHAHADHFGGNDYLIKKTSPKVYAPALESAVMANPYIEPLFLFGANPIPELTGRSLIAKRSTPDFIVSDGELKIGDRELTIVSLPGHSPNHIGVVSEAVCFTGDALAAEEAWRKHVVLYVADVGKALGSLERLRTVGAREFVPAHADPTSDISDLIDLNVAKMQEIADCILHILSVPTTAEEVLKIVADRHGLAITTAQQYYLTYSAIKAYLAYLADRELVRYFLNENRLFWEATE